MFTWAGKDVASTWHADIRTKALHTHMDIKPDCNHTDVGEGDSVKRQVAHLIASVQTVMRLPLIVLNMIAIIFLLIFG